MPLKSKLTAITIVISLLFYNCCYADSFVVTSNLDYGIGTLRNAMQRAADNGTAIPDTILFNLPGSTRADRTIILESTLPPLTSHLLIDGTSQPGAPFGISDARVQIENDFHLVYMTFFYAHQVNDIEIYGLYLNGIDAAYAIDFTGVNNFVFGKPGKGNIVNGFVRAFYSFHNSDYTTPSVNISFQSNLLGIDESGDFADKRTYNNTTFKFLDVYNVLVGGPGKDEGNLMCDDGNAMDLNYSGTDESGYLRIEGNKIGTDRTGLKKINGNSYGFSLNGSNDGVADTTGTSPVEVLIINNISAEGINLVKFKNYFKIQGNRFGVGADNVADIGQSYRWITVIFCPKGIIGGDQPGDKNFIANAPYVPGIYLFDCGSITISRNSLFCNGSGIDIGWILQRPKPFVNIHKVTSTDVAGNSLPNSTIELFYDDACPGCEGKTYIGSTTADANGNWFYKGDNSGGIVATATDPFGATSEFSTATLNTDNVAVKNASCGKANGSIKNVRVVSGTDWYWQDEAGKIIARETDLIDVPAGKYKFVSSIGGNGCKTESTVYEIRNADKPSIDTDLISMQQPSCGMNNGALKNNTAFNDSFQYQWVNKTDAVLLNDFSALNPFTGLAAGDYYLKLRLAYDSTCFTKYGPFKLVNQSGPSLNTDNIAIANSTCNIKNGSIKNITYQNAAGAVFTSWEDSTGKVVGNTMDLAGVGKGRYRLKLKDGSGCDTLITQFFEIHDAGTITVDTSMMIVKPASCKGSDGAVTKVTSTNAATFIWVDLSSGKIVGNREDVYGLPAGSYQLQLKNSYGCSEFLKPVIIGNEGFLPDTVTNVAITDANCFLDNGAIKINSFTRDSSFYSFQWTNSLNNTVISTNTSIQNLPAGFYTLTATDPNGCSGVIFAANIPQIGKPGFDTHLLTITGDTCYSGKGSIQNLLIRDSSWVDSIRAYTWAWYRDGRQINTSPGSLIAIPAGTYYATITDQFNCSVNSPLFTIKNTDITPDKPVVNDQYIPRHTSAVIAVANPQKGMYELYNDDLPGSPPLDSSTAGVLRTPAIAADRFFFVRYKNGNCVSPLSKLAIKVFDSTIIYVPNAFTPNNDHLNDRLRVTVKGVVRNFQMVVFDRFGSIVFSAKDTNEGWNGMVKGEPVPAGVYVYVITGITAENKSIQQKGLITVVR